MEKVKFKDIFTFEKKSKIKAGDGFKLGEGKYPFYTSSDTLSKTLNEFLFEKESLIFGTGGLASIHHSNDKFAVSTDCFVTQPKDLKSVYAKYVYFYLSGNMHLLENGFKGAGLKHISKGYIEDLEIPLPSLKIQQKIAAILDKANELRQYNNQLIEKYDALTQSLFLDMFGDPVKNEKGWETLKLGLVTNMKAGKFISASDIYSEKENDLFPCYGGNGLRGYVKSFTHDGNFVLIGRQGALCGNVKLTSEKFHATEHAIVCSPKMKYKTLWLYYLLGMLKLNRFSTGAAQPGLNVGTLVELEIMIVPYNLQTQFAERVQLIETQKKQAQEALAKSEALFQGLLQKAFNGELT
jgi:type I restriction enzyme S subunit